jgi:hypothetical protein
MKTTARPITTTGSLKRDKAGFQRKTWCESKGSTYTLRPGESSLVYSLIIVEDEPPAPAALVDIGFSVPSFKAAARRL